MADRTEVISVGPAESRQRLDRLLASRFPQHSRSYLQRLIREGHVTLASGSERLRASRPVVEGEKLAITFPPPTPTELIPESIPLSILFEDDHLLVLDKPAGLTVHPGAGAATGTLVHALLAHGTGLSGIGGAQRPGIVHRLDKQTSGLLVVAKNDAAHRELSRQFAAREVEKEYVALVWGVPRRVRGVVEAPIGRDARQRIKISTRTTSPRDAVTEYGVAEELAGFAWLEVRPRTGRTHQIRVHLKEIGHPIVGDDLYGGARYAQVIDPGRRAALASFTRLALHARRLAFTHPVTKGRLRLEAPIPDELRALLAALRA